jgi:hypothetical protein
MVPVFFLYNGFHLLLAHYINLTCIGGSLVSRLIVAEFAFRLLKSAYSFRLAVLPPITQSIRIHYSVLYSLTKTCFCFP